MSHTSALYLAILLPLLGAVFIAALRNHPNLREAATLVTSVVLFANVCWLVAGVANGATPRAANILPMPVSGLFLSLELEPLGAMFAAVASGLWIINSLYSIGYMRANKEKHQTRFYICFAIALSAAMGIALSGDLITLFVFYEVLTLATYPLVAHKQTAEAKAGARTYLLILLSSSVFLLLFAIAWTYDIAGTVAFAQGGILEGRIESWLAPVLLACFAFGIGKAALLPVHLWLPAAMVAPTPVSALLHAVAVVKAGVFTMLKVGIYIFGIDFLEQTGASQWLAWLAGISILYASARALAQDNLKARLAYSTVSQLSYVTLAMALATPLGALAGALQIAMHAFGKITLFMCAGAVYVASYRTQVSDLNGLARAMPITFAAFAVGALSIIGAPLLGGFWVKWEIIFAADTLEQLIFIVVMIASSILSLAYFAPIIGRGFFLPPIQASGDAPARAPKEAPLLCVLPPSISAIICIILFFQIEALWQFLEPIFEATP